MAKQCCVCKQKLRIFDTGYDYGGGLLVCGECEAKRQRLSGNLPDDEFEKLLEQFRPVIDVQETSNEIKVFFQNLQEKRNRIKNEHLQKFNGMKPEYEFKVKMRTLTQSYTSFVYVFKDRVMIFRNGWINSLPDDITLYYKDITAIQFVDMYGTARITFTVPGMGAGNVAVARNTAFGQAVDYSNDACSILFGASNMFEAKRHCDMIKQYYSAWKSRENTTQQGAAVIQQDTAVDKLKKLKELRDMGILTDAEYEEKRQKLLSEI